MSQLQETLQNYIPELEAFLTSVLLEETNIEISSADTFDAEGFTEGMDGDDIYILTQDEVSEAQVIAILHKDWFSLLSGIMLGVDESSFNEVTRDLLKKFSTELSVTLGKKLKNDGVDYKIQKLEVLTFRQLEEKLLHGEYAYFGMEVEGLADDKVSAGVAISNPEVPLVAEEPEEEETPQETEASEEEKFDEVPANELQEAGSREEVISGKYIEFEEFSNTPDMENGQGKSMDFLKDVEMDVSVELGRIELPLGKVLQLAKGSVIELEKLAGEPVDILVNGQRIAHGEVVVIDEHFGVRISNLITTRQRLATIA